MNSRVLHTEIEHCKECPYLYTKSVSHPFHLDISWHCKALPERIILHTSDDSGVNPQAGAEYGISVHCPLPIAGGRNDFEF